MLYHYYVVVSHAVGHEKRIVSVVPQEEKKESGAPMRSVNGIKKNTPQGMRRIFLAARPISYLHHTVLDHIVVTEQFLYDSTLYYMEQRLLQCI